MAGSITYGDQKSKASRVNSTSIPLANGTIFTGKWEMHSATGMMVNCKADQDCLVSIQFSEDRNTILSSKSFDVSANTAVERTFDKGMLWARVIITNASGSDMSSLVLATSYGDYDRAVTNSAGELIVTNDRIGTKTITYDVDGNISTINDGVTIKTFSYSGGNLSSIETAGI